MTYSRPNGITRQRVAEAKVNGQKKNGCAAFWRRRWASRIEVARLLLVTREATPLLAQQGSGE